MSVYRRGTDKPILNMRKILKEVNIQWVCLISKITSDVRIEWAGNQACFPNKNALAHAYYDLRVSHQTPRDHTGLKSLTW